MSPLIFCYILAIVGLVAVFVFVKGRLGLFSLISIILVFSALEAITDYPTMIDIDVNLQGSCINVITKDGHLSEAWNPYHKFYPGFFVLWSAVSLVTGVDVRASNVMIMLPITAVLLGLLLVSFYRKLGAEKGTSFTMGLLAFLLMNFHINEGAFLHFNTRLYALELTMLALLFFFDMISATGRKKQIVFLFVFYVVVISHVLFSMAVLMFMFVYWLIEKRHNRLLIESLFLGVLIYVAHNLSMASTVFGFYVGSFFNYLYLRIAQEMLITIPFVTENVPVLSVVLRTYYKILLAAIGLLAAYSLIKLRQKSGVRNMLYLLLAGIITFGATIFSASLGNSIVRGLMLLVVPLAFLSLFVIVGRHGRALRPQKLQSLTLAVVLLIIPQFLLVHETGWRALNLPSLDAASMFAAHTRNGQPIAAYGAFTHYYSFYEPKSWDYNLIGYYEEGMLPQAVNLSDIDDFLVQSGGIIFITFKDIQVLGYSLSSFDESYEMWTKEVFVPLESQCNKIYDNGFERIYR